MSYKEGSLVRPIAGCIGDRYLFKIIGKTYTSYPEYKWRYKLQRIEQAIDPTYGPIQEQLKEIISVENVIWEENELTIVGDSTQEQEPSPDYPQEIKSTTNLFNEAVKNIHSPTKEELEFFNRLVKEENNMKILDIYKERKEQEIINNLIKEKEKVIQEDEIQKIVKEMKEQINVILENEGRNEKVDAEEPISSLLTNKTNKKIVNLEAKHIIAKEKLHSTLEEIRALFELTEDYQERMKILKKYGIINKDGKVNI